MIDTATENIDDKLNLEFRGKVKNIIEQEKGIKNPATKKKTEEDIISYIKTNSKQ